jgi:hypothetical protein
VIVQIAIGAMAAQAVIAVIRDGNYPLAVWWLFLSIGSALSVK